MLEQYGTPAAALHATPSQWAATLGEGAVRNLQRDSDPALLERSLQWLREANHFLVTLSDDDYPPLLRETVNPPPVLYGMGRRELLTADMLAIVGSRHPTPQGESNAAAFAQALSDVGLTVVSGMALGIDAQAHRGGLKGVGSSVAVVGTGLDRVYPARHHELARTLATQGLMLSEFALGTAPLPGNFPRRNRIISGMSRGCLVVEAALNSGSLVTARLATGQGREVFAIPGSIHSPLSKGCHALIREGAKLVESVGDILEELRWTRSVPDRTNLQESVQSISDADRQMLDAMGFDPVSMDRLSETSGADVATVGASLMRLELAGHVVMMPGGLYQRVI